MLQLRTRLTPQSWATGADKAEGCLALSVLVHGMGTNAVIGDHEELATIARTVAQSAGALVMDLEANHL